MAKRTFLAGITSQTIDIFLQDSSSTIGAGLAGLAFNTANLKAYYRKGATGSATAITLATQTVGGAWSSGGFVELDATNMKGAYRFDVPDTILASSPWATIYFYGATNLAPVVMELEITAVNPFSATAFITGVNSLAPPTNWNLLSIDASGRTDLAKWIGVAPLALSSQQVQAVVPTTQKVDVETIKTQGVTCAAPVAVLASVGTAATSTAQTGDNYARIGAPAGASVSADVAAIQAKTTNLPAAPASTTNITAATGVVLSAAGVAAIWAYAVEGTATAVQYLRGIASASFGVLSGAATTTVVIQDVPNTKPRITATCDSSGNRTAVTTDLT